MMKSTESTPTSIPFEDISPRLDNNRRDPMQGPGFRLILRGVQTAVSIGANKGATQKPHKLLNERIIEAVQPGQTLEFIYRRNTDGRIDIELLGSGLETDTLNSTIRTILNHPLNQIYWFEDSDFDGPGSDNSNPLLLFRVLPIRSNSLSARSVAYNKVEDPSNEVWPISVILQEPSISELKVSFTGVNRDSDDSADLSGSISGLQSKFSVVLEAPNPAALTTARLFGNSLFGTSCQVVPASGLDSRSATKEFLTENDITLLPQCLPAPEFLPALTAESLGSEVLWHLPQNGFTLGTVRNRDLKIPLESRDLHFYIVGGTGTGKTTLMKRMILDDLNRDESLILLDPHGDLYDEVLERVPEHRREDVISISPESSDTPIPFNILDIPRDEYRNRRIAYVADELMLFFREIWHGLPEAFGPVFELYFRNAILLLAHQERPGANLNMFEQIFTDSLFRSDLIKSCNDAKTITFWEETAEKAKGEIALSNVTPYITSKMSVLTQSGFVSEMLGQSRDVLKLSERMNSRSIVLVNLDKGMLGEKESRLLGVLLTMQIFSAGLKRSALPVSERSPVNIYIDEFQNFLSGNSASMLAEARKFGLRLTLANQTLSQLTSTSRQNRLLESVLGNVGNMATFRLGIPDAKRLQPFLHPCTPEEIQRLPNHRALVRIMDNAGPIGPHIIRTLPE